MTYYSIAGSSRLDSEEIVSRLEKLRALKDEETFVVYRVRNGEEIESFDERSEAEEFISDEDYDPERVKVRAQAQELDSDDAEELEELERINADGESIFSDWGSITVTREYEVDAEEYGKEYIGNNYGTRSDLYSALDGYIDFEQLGRDLLENVEGGDIAGYTYVDL